MRRLGQEAQSGHRSTNVPLGRLQVRPLGHPRARTRRLPPDGQPVRPGTRDRVSARGNYREGDHPVSPQLLPHGCGTDFAPTKPHGDASQSTTPVEHATTPMRDTLAVTPTLVPAAVPVPGKAKPGARYLAGGLCSANRRKCSSSTATSIRHSVPSRTCGIAWSTMACHSVGQDTPTYSAAS